MLLKECEASNSAIALNTKVTAVRNNDRFYLATDKGDFYCGSLVIATGGLSIPKMGATDLGYKIARQFGIAVTEPRPALVPLTVGGEEGRLLRELSGVSLEADVAWRRVSFRENILFTHRGLSGPAILQISSYWKPNEAISIDLLPNLDAATHLKERKRARPRAEPKTVLAEILPARLAQALAEACLPLTEIANIPDRSLVAFAAR